MQTLFLPLPPSANNAFVNRTKGKGYGRIRSARYRAWRRHADAMYTLQGLGACPILNVPYRCAMTFPPFRGDLDGRAKLILDWLVSRQLTIDDRHCRKLELEKDFDDRREYVTVILEPWQSLGETIDAKD